MAQLNIKHAVIVGLIVVVIAYSEFSFRRHNAASDSANQIDGLGSGIEHNVDLAAQTETLIEETKSSIQQLSEEIADLIQRGEFGVGRARLMTLAAQAVETGDKKSLGNILYLLGQISTEEQDLDTAEVYLLEALDIYQSQDDTIGSARVYMQLGRTHLKSRQLARIAGSAYDRLLIARWQLNRWQYDEAEKNLRTVIDDNISINRYGAAASAYYSLTDLYTEINDTYKAELAAIEAVKLYAASGQLRRANSLLKDLENAGIEPGKLVSIEQDVEQQYNQFNNSIAQIERARDYRRLFHHYRAKGDNERAWKLRVLASQSLAKVSKRAMFHRQPDVLAVLHNSNVAMKQAEDYLSLAKKTFDSEGLEELSDKSLELSAQVF